MTTPDAVPLNEAEIAQWAATIETYAPQWIGITADRAEMLDRDPQIAALTTARIEAEKRAERAESRIAELESKPAFDVEKVARAVFDAVTDELCKRSKFDVLRRELLRPIIVEELHRQIGGVK